MPSGRQLNLGDRPWNATTLETALRRVLTPEVAVTAQSLGRALLSEPDATTAIVERIEAAGRTEQRASA